MIIQHIFKYQYWVHVHFIESEAERNWIEGSYEKSKKLMEKILKIDRSLQLNNNIIFLDPTHLGAFGEFSLQIDTFIKAQKLGLINNVRPKLLMKKETIPNLYLAKLWSKYIDIEMDEKKIKSLFPLSIKYRTFQKWIYNGRSVEMDAFGAPYIQKLWDESKYRGKALVRLKKDEIKFGKKNLLKFGILEKDWYVVFHLSENKNEHSLRRVNNPRTYFKAMKLIIKLGGKVIQIGRSEHQPFEKNNNYFDLCDDSINNPFMNIFLLSTAKFVVCSASGPNHLPHIFGKPCLWTNIFPTASVPILKKDRYIHKRWEKNGKKLTLEEIYKTDLSRSLLKETFNGSSIKIKDNNENEIFLAVKEMLDNIENGFAVSKYQIKINNERVKLGYPEGGGHVCNSFKY